ncbi:MAG: ABC transporter permease [Methanomassiliicoccales archaeon]|nr:ABC transporter permease [Methanomassiliicoccales archaeon]
MDARRVWSVARRELRALKHDRRTVAFLVLMPLLMIALFGYTFGGSLTDVKVDIVDLDLGAPGLNLGADISAKLGQSSVLKIVAEYGPGNESEVAASVQRVADAQIWATIIFDANFTNEVNTAMYNMTHGLPVHPVPVVVKIDASNPNLATAVMGEVQMAVQQELVEKYHLIPPMVVQEDRVYGQGAEFIDFFAPGVMGLAAMMVTFMLSIVSFIHERTAFTLERVLTTPITEGEFVAGYALAFGLVGLIQSIVILSTAVILFNIQVVGSLLLVLLIIFLLGIGMQGLGFLLSAGARSEFQAVQFMPLILFPSILLAGVFWPIESVPEILRPVSYFIPLTYAVDGTRSVMIRGWGLDQVWFPIVILIAFAAAMLLLSTYRLKKRG